ncbi:MAG: periplasmic heavy metal sensor [bacterium]|nr:periplasmic heavy metal sensor [bacterium]
MKKYALYLALIFSVAINVAVAATVAYHFWRLSRAENWRPSCDQKPLGRFMRENLQLEAEDIVRFQSLLAQDREELIALRKQVREQQQALFDLLDKPNINQTQIDQQIEKIATLQAKMQKIVINRIINLKSTLPEEKQQRLLRALRQRLEGGSFGPGAFGPGFGKKMRRW